MDDKGFDLLTGGFAESFGAAEIDSVGLHQVGVELVLADRKPDAAGARSVPQYTLVVADAAKAFATLTARSQSGEFPAPAPLSTTRDGKRQTSVVDPDGTRVILSE